jgi:DNA-binding NtrC family response regulator
MTWAKELVTRLLRKLLRRFSGKLRRVKESALSARAFEGKFFGRETGASAGVGTRKLDMIERLHKLTLWLDEIGRTP